MHGMVVVVMEEISSLGPGETSVLVIVDGRFMVEVKVDDDDDDDGTGAVEITAAGVMVTGHPVMIAGFCGI